MFIYSKPGKLLTKSFIDTRLDAFFIENQWYLEKRKVQKAKFIRVYIDYSQDIHHLVIPKVIERRYIKSKWNYIYVVSYLSLESW